MNRRNYLTQLLVAVLILVAHVAHAEQFVFASNASRLVLTSDGSAASLTSAFGGRELLLSSHLPFATVRKAGRVYPSTAINRVGAGFHFVFGDSGISADYHILASVEYITVELVAVQGTGLEEFRFVQLSTPLANAGKLLGVRWDDQFALCLMGLDQQVDSKLSGPQISASAYPEFSLQNQKIAIIAAPTPHFLDAVQTVEHDFKLPSPTLGGTWAKLSKDVQGSYLFTDLTEANVDETIRYAKLGGFKYALIYAGTWSATLGSYQINSKSFPHGEVGLRAAIDKCHASGLKVGLHMLMSYVQKTDPLVRPRPDPGLFKEGETRLARDIDAKATELPADSAPVAARGSVRSDASDVVIDDEIVHCNHMSGGQFLECQRGVAGTNVAAHMQGAKIQRLHQQGASYYLVDPKSPLEGVISARIAGLINRAGIDMIYFDGGGLDDPTRPSWYWAGVQPLQIWEQSKRDLLVEGGGISHWAWHIVTRGTCDDYAAVAVKQYLDYHKIADAWRSYHDNFLPAELGWVGFLQDTPDHPATTPDELEYHAVRMLALDSAISLETSLGALHGNGRTDEMLKLLNQYEQLRLSGAVPQSTRDRLAHGEWHMTTPGEFHPIEYAAQRLSVPGEARVKNIFPDQPLKFRLQAVPDLAAIDDPSNIPLLRAPPVTVPGPGLKDAMPGALARRIELSKNAQPQDSAFVVSASDRTQGKALDLTTHRALAVQLDVEGPPSAAGLPPVLNVQLETGGKTYRDYYIDLDFRGSRTVVLPEPSTSRLLPEFRPAPTAYPFKSAMYGFNYADIIAVNLRWMRASATPITVRIIRVEALQERNSSLRDLQISSGSSKIAIPGMMNTGDYAEYWGEGSIRIFDRNGVLLRTVPMNIPGPQMRNGEGSFGISAAGPGSVKFTTITLGK